MKKLIPYILFVFVIFISCNKATVKPDLILTADPVPTEQIDAFIKSQIEQNGEFEWKSASVEMVWSALQHSDNIMSIGYRPLNENNVEDQLHAIDIKNAAWKSAKDKLLEMILCSEQQLDKSLTLNGIVQWEENFLPVITITVRNLATVKILRENGMVRYAEPMGYEPQDAVKAVHTEANSAVVSSSGCGSNIAEGGLVSGVDYTTITPNTKQSWNYSYHNIPQAWVKSTGAGSKVFIIDTGCEFDQENLGSAFNQGSSSGRSVEKIVTLPRSTFFGIPTGPVETPDDGCGHGTSMAGACAAPRGTDGAACGVAYNCNLVVCRAAEDVFMDASREVKGASDAFTNAGNRADVKVISISMGRITSSSQMKDAILYAYGKGKLIFCAAGTSFSWAAGWFGVIFPATLNEVNAVTGVRDNNFNTTCTECHKGSQTDFTIVMEKGSNTERHALTLAMTGDAPSTVGGSSVATATAAGIAALVFSRFPGITRDAALTKLTQTSANYPTKNSNLGWGNLNADAATN